MRIDTSDPEYYATKSDLDDPKCSFAAPKPAALAVNHAFYGDSRSLAVDVAEVSRDLGLADASVASLDGPVGPDISRVARLSGLRAMRVVEERDIRVDKRDDKGRFLRWDTPEGI